ncbi:Uncharacterized protein DAT39_004256 [Clarias magur]|uniref:Uncharacterized protein n=1 Tax=Clarias magur TaxID=1594786 RepID=A0A8J4XEE9_CLAMG|nr:Uncharacterized protein DAT39_004256 [Clarias magur]
MPTKSTDTSCRRALCRRTRSALDLSVTGRAECRGSHFKLALILTPLISGDSFCSSLMTVCTEEIHPAGSMACVINLTQ